jgi:hypothetical protein
MTRMTYRRSLAGTWYRCEIPEPPESPRRRRRRLGLTELVSRCYARFIA